MAEVPAAGHLAEEAMTAHAPVLTSWAIFSSSEKRIGGEKQGGAAAQRLLSADRNCSKDCLRHPCKGCAMQSPLLV